LLSEREQEVIGLVPQAYTNGQIARRLGIAEGTVKRHVNSIFIKLDAVSRLDAVNKYTQWRTERPARPIRPSRSADGKRGRCRDFTFREIIRDWPNRAKPRRIRRLDQAGSPRLATDGTRTELRCQ
jgi:DNA-binding CsgD family transcriptional regulator